MSSTQDGPYSLVGKVLPVDRLSNRCDGLHSLEDFVLYGSRDGCRGAELGLRVIFFLCWILDRRGADLVLYPRLCLDTFFHLFTLTRRHLHSNRGS